MTTTYERLVTIPIFTASFLSVDFFYLLLTIFERVIVIPIPQTPPPKYPFPCSFLINLLSASIRTPALLLLNPFFGCRWSPSSYYF
jgi:hypothetical protein